MFSYKKIFRSSFINVSVQGFLSCLSRASVISRGSIFENSPWVASETFSEMSPVSFRKSATDFPKITSRGVLRRLRWIRCRNVSSDSKNLPGNLGETYSLKFVRTTFLDFIIKFNRDFSQVFKRLFQKIVQGFLFLNFPRNPSNISRDF